MNLFIYEKDTVENDAMIPCATGLEHIRSPIIEAVKNVNSKCSLLASFRVEMHCRYSRRLYCFHKGFLVGSMLIGVFATRNGQRKLGRNDRKGKSQEEGSG